jgi:hypothetical protein
VNTYATQRIAALAIAAILELAPKDRTRPVRSPICAADELLAWLTKPPPITTVILVAGTPADRNQPGGTMSLVMPDNDQVTITVAALDSENVAVADTFTDPAGLYLAPFTWAVDVAALGVITPSADTLSVVLDSAEGQTGTVVVTATDANGKVVPSFSVEIDPSAAVSAGLVAGTPVARTDTPAPAAPGEPAVPTE